MTFMWRPAPEKTPEGEMVRSKFGFEFTLELPRIYGGLTPGLDSVEGEDG